MSSSLSTMPFSRQYGSFRMSTTGNSNTAPGTGSHANHRLSHGSISQVTRHSSGTEAGQQVASAARLQMAPHGYRIGNLARQSSSNWVNSSSNTTTFAAIRQQKISSQQQQQQPPAQEHVRSAASAVGKQSHADRCAVHRAAAVAGSTAKKLGEPIGDTPLLQSPRIIARSARIVEPNAWNRRLTTSGFCTMASATASQPHHTGNRLLQTSLACRKSPGSSGTSVESIVPKYTRANGGANGASGVGGAETTAAQKRTYNAHKPQTRVVSSRTLTNTSGRVGTVAKKATGSAASQDAEREVAKVLHHHNMRVIDLLNNNHLQQQTNRTGRLIKENNENHQPAVTVTPNGGQKPSGPKKGSAIPQRLPLADRDQPTDRNRRLLLGECFSSKFPNGLPFEQEFYYRRSGQDSDTVQPLNEVEPDAEKEEEEEDTHNCIGDPYQRLRKSKKHALLPRRQGGGGVTLAGRRVAMTQQDLQHRSRSVSSSDEATPPAPNTTLAEERRSVSTIEREHDDEDALYVDFTKVHDPQSVEHQREKDESPGSAQTSVVEYRNINHSSYYYKFESISSHRKDSSQRKLLQRRPGDAGNTDGRQEMVRNRYQRSRLGMNRAVACSPDANGNTGREYYDDDEERLQCHDGETQIDEFEEEELEDDGEEEEDEEEGERSTVYVAVATWVPKCNRLPNESSENNNTICLTLPANGNNQDIDQQQQQQQQQQPTRIAVATNPTTLAAPTNRTGLPVPAPLNFGQLDQAGPSRRHPRAQAQNPPQRPVREPRPILTRPVLPSRRVRRLSELLGISRNPEEYSTVPSKATQQQHQQQQHLHEACVKTSKTENGQTAQTNGTAGLRQPNGKKPSPVETVAAVPIIDARNQRSKSPPRSCSNGKGPEMTNGGTIAPAVNGSGGGGGGVGGAGVTNGNATAVPNTIRGSGPNGELTLKDVPVSGISFQEIFKPDHEGPPTTQVIIYKPKSGKGQPTAKVIVTKQENQQQVQTVPDLANPSNEVSSATSASANATDSTSVGSINITTDGKTSSAANAAQVNAANQPGPSKQKAQPRKKAAATPAATAAAKKEVKLQKQKATKIVTMPTNTVPPNNAVERANQAMTQQQQQQQLLQQQHRMLLEYPPRQYHSAQPHPDPAGGLQFIYQRAHEGQMQQPFQSSHRSPLANVHGLYDGYVWRVQHDAPPQHQSQRSPQQPYQQTEQQQQQQQEPGRPLLMQVPSPRHQMQPLPLYTARQHPYEHHSPSPCHMCLGTNHVRDGNMIAPCPHLQPSIAMGTQYTLYQIHGIPTVVPRAAAPPPPQEEQDPLQIEPPHQPIRTSYSSSMLDIGRSDGARSQPIIVGRPPLTGSVTVRSPVELNRRAHGLSMSSSSPALGPSALHHTTSPLARSNQPDVQRSASNLSEFWADATMNRTSDHPPRTWDYERIMAPMPPARREISGRISAPAPGSILVPAGTYRPAAPWERQQRSNPSSTVTSLTYSLVPVPPLCIRPTSGGMFHYANPAPNACGRTVEQSNRNNMNLGTAGNALSSATAAPAAAAASPAAGQNNPRTQPMFTIPLQQDNAVVTVSLISPTEESQPSGNAPSVPTTAAATATNAASQQPPASATKTNADAAEPERDGAAQSAPQAAVQPEEPVQELLRDNLWSPELTAALDREIAAVCKETETAAASSSGQQKQTSSVGTAAPRKPLAAKPLTLGETLTKRMAQWREMEAAKKKRVVTPPLLSPLSSTPEPQASRTCEYSTYGAVEIPAAHRQPPIPYAATESTASNERHYHVGEQQHYVNEPAAPNPAIYRCAEQHLHATGSAIPNVRTVFQGSAYTGPEQHQQMTGSAASNDRIYRNTGSAVSNVRSATQSSSFTGPDQLPYPTVPPAAHQASYHSAEQYQHMTGSAASNDRIYRNTGSAVSNVRSASQSSSYTGPDQLPYLAVPPAAHQPFYHSAEQRQHTAGSAVPNVKSVSQVGSYTGPEQRQHMTGSAASNDRIYRDTGLAVSNVASLAQSSSYTGPEQLPYPTQHLQAIVSAALNDRSVTQSNTNTGPEQRHNPTIPAASHPAFYHSAEQRLHTTEPAVPKDRSVAQSNTDTGPEQRQHPAIPDPLNEAIYHTTEQHLQAIVSAALNGRSVTHSNTNTGPEQRQHMTGSAASNDRIYRDTGLAVSNVTSLAQSSSFTGPDQLPYPTVPAASHAAIYHGVEQHLQAIVSAALNDRSVTQSNTNTGPEQRQHMTGSAASDNRMYRDTGSAASDDSSVSHISNYTGPDQLPYLTVPAASNPAMYSSAEQYQHTIGSDVSNDRSVSQGSSYTDPEQCQHMTGSASSDDRLYRDTGSAVSDDSSVCHISNYTSPDRLPYLTVPASPNPAMYHSVEQYQHTTGSAARNVRSVAQGSAYAGPEQHQHMTRSAASGNRTYRDTGSTVPNDRSVSQSSSYTGPEQLPYPTVPPAAHQPFYHSAEQHQHTAGSAVPNVKSVSQGSSYTGPEQHQHMTRSAASDNRTYRDTGSTVLNDRSASQSSSYTGPEQLPYPTVPPAAHQPFYHSAEQRQHTAGSTVPNVKSVSQGSSYTGPEQHQHMTRSAASDNRTYRDTGSTVPNDRSVSQSSSYTGPDQLPYPTVPPAAHQPFYHSAEQRQHTAGSAVPNVKSVSQGSSYTGPEQHQQMTGSAIPNVRTVSQGSAYTGPEQHQQMTGSAASNDRMYCGEEQHQHASITDTGPARSHSFAASASSSVGSNVPPSRLQLTQSATHITYTTQPQQPANTAYNASFWDSFYRSPGQPEDPARINNLLLALDVINRARDGIENDSDDEDNDPRYVNNEGDAERLVEEEVDEEDEEQVADEEYEGVLEECEYEEDHEEVEEVEEVVEVKDEVVSVKQEVDSDDDVVEVVKEEPTIIAEVPDGYYQECTVGSLVASNTYAEPGTSGSTVKRKGSYLNINLCRDPREPVHPTEDARVLTGVDNDATVGEQEQREQTLCPPSQPMAGTELLYRPYELYGPSYLQGVNKQSFSDDSTSGSSSSSSSSSNSNTANIASGNNHPIKQEPDSESPEEQCSPNDIEVVPSKKPRMD